MNKTLVFLSCAALIAGAAVTSSPARAADDEIPSDFGDSVRHMIDQQIYDRQAATKPPADPPTQFDGESAAAALKAYREAPGRPTTPMTNEIPIGVSSTH